MNTRRDETPKYLYNPDGQDFTVDYAVDDNPPEPYTIRAGEAQSFPPYIADHIARHLAHLLISKRGIKTNYDDDFKATIEEITIHETER